MRCDSPDPHSLSKASHMAKYDFDRVRRGHKGEAGWGLA
jgi:hypothetical protein